MSIIPGLGMVPAFLGGGIGYGSLLLQITNRTFHMDASSAGGIDGNTLAATNFPNAGSAGGSARAASSTWRANRQNGLMGVEVGNANGIDAGGSNMPTINQVFGSTDKVYTIWLVGKKTGSLANSTLVYDRAGAVFIPIGITSAGDFTTHQRPQSGDNAPTYTWGPTYSVGVPFVASVKVSAAGALRVNVSGTAATPSGTLSVDGAWDPSLRLIMAGSTGFDFFECLISNDDVGATLQDAFVTALKTKWGIA